MPTSPPGSSPPTDAWAVLACLAHNLLRWTQLLGPPGTTVRTARTLRRRLVGLSTAETVDSAIPKHSAISGPVIRNRRRALEGAEGTDP